MPPTSTPHLQCHLLDTGYCLAYEAMVMQGGRFQQIACHAPVALLQHPAHGWFLFDTGYAPRIFESTESWPKRLFRYVTPLRLNPRLATVAQLGALGLTADDIQAVVISHFHADHVAGLHDFPRARLIASRAAWDDLCARQGFAALTKGFLLDLIPTDFAARATLIDTFAGPTLPALGSTHDLFADGSALLIPLPGHACGQMGLLVQTDRGPILLAADGSWLTRSYRERRPPARFADQIAHDPQALIETLNRLHDFALARPDVAIVPTHCAEALGRELHREAAAISAP